MEEVTSRKRTGPTVCHLKELAKSHGVKVTYKSSRTGKRKAKNKARLIKELQGKGVQV